MIVEKPSGVRHGGLAIFSIDVQPGGQRFATGGGDQKVRIWHLPPVTKDAEVDQSSHTLLATIRDHFGSVNCVRWAKHGRYIASCSDDKIIHIHEKKPGSGTTEFGSGEPADIENWKLVATLRGHTADVVDLNWSPDDSMLASCSLDNTVHVWNMSDMGCISVLRGHSSLVKGVTWDPIGSFLASQSDDKSVIIWRTSDWSLEHRTEGHWGKSVGSTFFRRLGWSPCGHFVTTTHGFQKPSHSAPVLERGDWSATFDFLGHNAPVVAVRFNHLMFRKNPGSISELLDVQQVESTGQANGSSKSGKKDVVPYNVIAIGSQDCSITVWTTASPRPIFVGKHFFQQSVVDLSWSPDGYSLLCCSTDGSIAAFHFESKELGYKVSEVELDDVKRNRYGDVRGRQASLAESPAQLLLEAAAAKQLGSKKTVTTSQRNNFSGKPPSNAEPQIPLKVPNGEVPVTGKTTDALSAPTKPAPPKAHSPVKQREYRRADGRKRIIPEPVGVPAQQECPPENVVVNVKDSVNPDSSLKSNVQQVSSVDGNASLSGHKRSLDDKLTEYPNKCAKTGTEVATGFSARAGVANNLTIQMCQNTSEQNARGSFSNSELITVLNSENPRGLLSIQVREIDCDSKSMPSCLEAKPSKTDLVEASNVNTIKETELVCSKGTIIQWQDKLYGKATVLAGNSNFWAVGCDDGSLQVYTKCGRRALPTMMVGSAPTFIDCDEDWKLLVVTQRGLIYVWDLCNWTCLLQDSLAPLVNMSINSSSKGSGVLKIISARFSRSGSPLIVLATRHAYLLHPTMKCWLRVADDCFPASNFSSSWPAASQNGELASLQADVGRFAMRNISWIRGLTEDTTQTRAHLEAQIASAVALKSPIEYRQNLLAYARCLTRESDEVRLREMCEFFFGPPTGVVESSCSDSTLSCQDQYVLGMKKHELLREVILPAMASNRKVQRLLNEFIDLLSQYEGKNLNVLMRQSENSDVNMET